MENEPASWTGEVIGQTSDEMEVKPKRPAGWPPASSEVTSYVLTGDTGFPVKKTGKNRIVVDRFPLQAGATFQLPCVGFKQED